jgi:hypothetical protein
MFSRKMFSLLQGVMYLLRYTDRPAGKSGCGLALLNVEESQRNSDPILICQSRKSGKLQPFGWLEVRWMRRVKSPDDFRWKR